MPWRASSRRRVFRLPAALISQLQSAQKGSSTKQKLQTFVYMVQQASGKSITAAYATLLANWGQDLVNRTP